MPSLFERFFNRAPKLEAGVSPETEIRSVEFADYAQTDLRRFLEYTKNSGAGAAALWEVIYTDFYTQNTISSSELNKQGGELPLTAEQRDLLAAPYIERYGQKRVAAPADLNWLQLETANPLHYHHGKFFIASKPEMIRTIQTDIIDEADRRQLSLTAKAALDLSPQRGARADAVVVYGREHQEEKLMELLHSIHAKHSDNLSSQRPAFSAPLLPGISFGEEHAEKGKNFGRVRSEMLASILSRIRKDKLDQNNFKLMAVVLQGACMRYELDYTNPAFLGNERTWRKLRSAQKTTMV